ncbi:unnamed protein product [Scytosiphon promiscuus]
MVPAVGTRRSHVTSYDRVAGSGEAVFLPCLSSARTFLRRASWRGRIHAGSVLSICPGSLSHLAVLVYYRPVSCRPGRNFSPLPRWPGEVYDAGAICSEEYLVNVFLLLVVGGWGGTPSDSRRDSRNKLSLVRWASFSTTTGGRARDT